MLPRATESEILDHVEVNFVHFSCNLGGSTHMFPDSFSIRGTAGGEDKARSIITDAEKGTQNFPSTKNLVRRQCSPSLLNTISTGFHIIPCCCSATFIIWIFRINPSLLSDRADGLDTFLNEVHDEVLADICHPDPG